MSLGSFAPSQPLTLGVELELQIVNNDDYDLAPVSGDLLRLMGDAAAAETDLRQALVGQQKVLGERHQWTLYAVACLALLLAQQGRTDEAAAVYADALQGAPVGPQSPEAKANVAELSRLLDERGDGVAAAKLLQRFGCE